VQQLVPPMRVNASGTPSAARPPDRNTTPFPSAAEALFWTIRTSTTRGATALRGAAPTIRRPCEPGEVLRVLDTLYRRRRLDTAHLRVLARWGARGVAPCPQRHRADSALWREGIDRVAGLLRPKGIVT
jgi:hypothetical protein